MLALAVKSSGIERDKEYSGGSVSNSNGPTALLITD
jgi:hypothetical protein